jgi:glycosyltransferase involved in cell wall biosynthesis
MHPLPETAVSRFAEAAAPKPQPGRPETTLPRPRPAPLPKLRVLTFSTLFPNPAQTNHGVFVENRLRHLVASGEIDSTVLAPVPWFPGRSPGRAAIPAHEVQRGITVHHPRYLAPAGIGMFSNPFSLYRAARNCLARLVGDGLAFDLIDAHYLYPDGVAAVWLGREFGRPVVVTARGSDTSQLPHYRFPGHLIRRTIRDADALIAVSAALKAGLVALGAPESKVSVLRNGVDLTLFRPPADRAAVRASLGLDGPTLLAVGHLIERKRLHLTIEALRILSQCRLLIIGEGPERAALGSLAERIGVAQRVRFIGSVPHEDLPRYYAAADIMVLASSREGWANVLLESMACGTPVVATPAWGSHEAVTAPEAGIVIEAASAEAIAAAVRRLIDRPPARTATAAYAEQFSWDETTAGQLRLFRQVMKAA